MIEIIASIVLYACVYLLGRKHGRLLERRRMLRSTREIRPMMYPSAGDRHITVREFGKEAVN